MSWIPEEKRIEVATLYAVTRNISEVSKISGVSPETIRKMKAEPWFSNVVQRVVKDKNDVLDQKLSDSIEQCADLIKERLVEGDTRINYKTGEIHRVPLDARGLAMVMGIIFDKRQLIRGEATSRTETVSFDKRLENLKDAFERFSKASEITGERLHEGRIQQKEPKKLETLENTSSGLLEPLEVEVATTPLPDPQEANGEPVIGS